MTWRCRKFGCRPAELIVAGTFRGWGRCIRRACRMYEGKPPGLL